MSDRTSRIEISDTIPPLTPGMVGAASPDYVRQGRVRILHYRTERPGIGLRIRYTQEPPPPSLVGGIWQGAPIHGDSPLLSRPWARRVETMVSVGVGSSALEYTLTSPEVSLWVPGDSVSVDVSLTHHVRWHPTASIAVPGSATRTDPRAPSASIEAIPPVLALASAWPAPVQSGSGDLVYSDTVVLAVAGATRPLSVIPPWARWVTVYPSEIGTATNWTVSFLWPYQGAPFGQTLLSTLQQSSTVHLSERPLPIPPGAVFCSVGGITQAVTDWTFTYTGTL